MKNKSIHFIITILLSFVLSGSLYSSDKSAEIDKLITACHKNTIINGAVLVAEKGEIIYKKAMGIANVEWDIPVDTETRFNIYSMSKQFTAMLAMILVEEGKIKLDGKISVYLPYFR